MVASQHAIVVAIHRAVGVIEETAAGIAADAHATHRGCHGPRAAATATLPTAAAAAATAAAMT